MAGGRVADDELEEAVVPAVEEVVVAEVAEKAVEEVVVVVEVAEKAEEEAGAACC
jgi:hypothetical protein